MSSDSSTKHSKFRVDWERKFTVNCFGGGESVCGACVHRGSRMNAWTTVSGRPHPSVNYRNTPHKSTHHDILSVTRGASTDVKELPKRETTVPQEINISPLTHARLRRLPVPLLKFKNGLDRAYEATSRVRSACCRAEKGQQHRTDEASGQGDPTHSRETSLK